MPLGLAARLPPGAGDWLAGVTHARARGVNGERRASGVPGQRPPFGSHRNHPGDGSVRRPPDGTSTPAKILAWVHIVLGGAGLIAGAVFCLQFVISPNWLSNFALGFALPIYLFLSLVWFVPALIGATGLLLGKNWGRLILFLLSVGMLIVFPLGTLLGGFGLMALRADQEFRT